MGCILYFKVITPLLITFMSSLEYAAQEKTEILLRGKGSKHILKNDEKDAS